MKTTIKCERGMIYIIDNETGECKLYLSENTKSFVKLDINFSHVDTVGEIPGLFIEEMCVD